MNELLILAALNREARAASRQLRGRRITVHVVGIGANHLPAETARVVLLAGYAGALAPDLRVGDMVIDDPRGRAAGLPCRYGPIYCSEKILATALEKQQAFERTGALAVDMESQRVREWADRLGADYIGARAITDAADHPLDPRLLAAVDEFGRPRPGVILRRPQMVPAMLRLAAATRQADAALADAVAAIVKLMAP